MGVIASTVSRQELTGCGALAGLTGVAKWLKLVSLALILWVTACQAVVTDKVLESAEMALIVDQREHQLLELTDFKVSGGLGIWTQEQNIPARFVWLQTGKRLQLSLSGPGGIGDTRLLDENGQVTLSRGNRLLAQGDSTSRVLQQGLGLQAPIPLDQISFWVRGLPGSANSVVRDAQGRLSSVRFTDEVGVHWQARFRQYTMFEGVTVPALITASGGQYSVRLVLKKWQLPSTSVVPSSTKSNKRLPIPGR